MRRIAVLFAVAVAAALLAVQVAAGAGKPSIAVTGTSVKDRVVTVTVKIAGWRMLPARIGRKPNAADGGHWHLFVDGKYAAASAGPRASSRKLSAGTHTVRAELANNDHSSLRPRALSAVVTVKVAAAASGGGATVPDGGATDTSGAVGAYGY